MRPDVGFLLLRALQWPIGRFFESDWDFIMAEATSRADDYDEYMGNHIVRTAVWGFTTAGTFSVGLIAAVVENEMARISADPVSGFIENVFIVCMVTGFLHGIAGALAHWLKRRQPGKPPPPISRLFLRPGNRYLAVATIFGLLLAW